MVITNYKAWIIFVPTQMTSEIQALGTSANAINFI